REHPKPSVHHLLHKPILAPQEWSTVYPAVIPTPETLPDGLGRKSSSSGRSTSTLPTPLSPTVMSHSPSGRGTFLVRNMMASFPFHQGSEAIISTFGSNREDPRSHPPPICAIRLSA